MKLNSRIDSQLSTLRKFIDGINKFKLTGVRAPILISTRASYIPSNRIINARALIHTVWLISDAHQRASPPEGFNGFRLASPRPGIKSCLNHVQEPSRKPAPFHTRMHVTYVTAYVDIGKGSLMERYRCCFLARTIYLPATSYDSRGKYFGLVSRREINSLVLILTDYPRNE